MIVVISWTEWLQDTQVRRMVDASNAAAYVDALPADRTAFIFDTDAADWLAAELTYGTGQLAHIFNALAPDAPVRKFENRDVALRRVGLKIIDIARGLSETAFVSPPNQEKDDMAREAMIGEFKPIGRNTHIGKIVAAYQDGTRNLDEIAALTTLTSEQVVGYLRGARAGGIAHAVDKETRAVTLTIPDGVEVFRVPKADQPKKEKAAREPKFGEFSQVRAGSRLAKIIEASPATAADIGVLCELTADEVLGHLKRARVSHGIDHAVGEGGEVTIFAYRMPADTVLIRPPTEPKPVRESSGVKSVIPENATITLLVEKNPKRPTAAAHARFELYRSGQTVSEFLAAGGTKADLSWDRVHEFIRIDSPKAEQAQAAE